MSEEAIQPILVGGSFAGASVSLRDKTRPYVKRLFDFCVALALIIIVLPVACLIIVASVVTGGSPIYSHVRIGRGGREFGCLKFRSMRRDADIVLTRLLQHDPAAKLEWEVSLKLRNDPRVTRLGRFLRETSLDELPQLINVLIGHMSLVGPRPVTKDGLTRFYCPSEAASYCYVRPGLTGLWQVSGRSEAGYDKRVALDMRYIQRLFLRTDLMILFQTIDVVVRQRGAW